VGPNQTSTTARGGAKSEQHTHIAIQRRVWPWVPLLYVVLASIVLLDLVTDHSSSPESDLIGVALFLGLALWQTVAVFRLKHAEVTNRDFLDRQ